MNAQLMQEAMILMDKAKKYDELIAFPERKLEMHCSFCGKGQSEVVRMVASKQASICDECIEICKEILDEGDDRDGITEGTNRNEP
ncbi:ClpX C4-type zinc finger protein [Paenibacillus sp. USHLN196]|uniref:ClpX C4-type zinc finger protein n=1 Tax=Paenibacillus sp. USHLN196 TaxID=3081291 RepID=UPI003017F0F1